MEARELRIGNYVQRYGEIITVDGIDDIDVFNKNCGEIPLHSVEPIPLTEDWLVKFGFNKINNGRYINYIKKQWVIEIEEELSIVYHNYDKLLMAVKYVHQLQNLYFPLTGEELKII